MFTFISNRLAPLTIIGAVIAYLYPPAFLIFKSYFLWFFAATMFALGLVLKTEELKEEWRKPKRLALGVDPV